MNQFKLAIICLESRLGTLISELKSGKFNQQTLNEKLEIEDAIKNLKFNAQNGITASSTVQVLPKHTDENYGEFFEYRIMNDNESDDVTKWSELIDVFGEKIMATPGDLLIKK